MRLKSERYDEIKLQVVHLYETCGVHTWPISCQEICMKMGIRLIPYSGLTEKKREAVKKISKDGFHILVEDLRTGDMIWVIYYNDANSRQRIRWTILHEIGHIILDHTEESELSESEANFFAKYALAPPPLVHAAGCEDFIDIQIKFDISVTAAFYAMHYYNKWLMYHGPSVYQEHELRMLYLFGMVT